MTTSQKHILPMVLCCPISASNLHTYKTTTFWPSDILTSCQSDASTGNPIRSPSDSPTGHQVKSLPSGVPTDSANPSSTVWHPTINQTKIPLLDSPISSYSPTMGHSSTISVLLIAVLNALFMIRNLGLSLLTTHKTSLEISARISFGAIEQIYYCMLYNFCFFSFKETHTNASVGTLRLPYSVFQS